MLFVVSYTLNPARVNTQLTEELMKSTCWMHYFDNTWLIGTNEDEKQLYARLKPFFQDSDLSLIIEIKRQSLYTGWLPQEGWNWLKEMYQKGWVRL